MRPKRHHKVLQPRDEGMRAPRTPPVRALRRKTSPEATLIRNAGQLLTLAGGSTPRTGEQAGELGLVPNGAVALQGGRIAAIGATEDLEAEFRGAAAVDARGGVVMPGFVDAHTHLVFAGDRVEEADMKARGMSYAEIAQEGGGILKTVGLTVEAPTPRLVEQAKARLDAALRTGTTTMEAKTGYGLDPAEELRLLDAITTLDGAHPATLVPTLMAAHALPPRYADRREAFLTEVAENLLPQASGHGAVYCDVFCESGYFSVDESRDLLLEARRHGLDAKIHADELTHTGGAELAGEIGAISADHLLHASEDGLRAMAEALAIAVLLPGTSLTTGGVYADARTMVELEVPVALGTDFNPNCWVTSMPLVLSLAVYRLGLTTAEAVVAATINAAHAVGAANEVGSLEVGKAADLLILDTTDYRNIAYRVGAQPVRAVYKGGVLVAGGA